MPTYKQEFGAFIDRQLVTAGFEPIGTGGNVAAWHKPLPDGRTLSIAAYDGQLYAEPCAAVWLLYRFRPAESEPETAHEKLTLAEAIEAARGLDGQGGAT